MKLNKSQKLEAYTFAMLIELSNDFSGVQWWCVCYSLKVWMNNGDEDVPKYSFGHTHRVFDEFRQQKPLTVDINERWWGSASTERLAAIERAIQLTEQLKK